jgi:hypothetical protein
MALLPPRSLREYEVTLKPPVGNVIIDHVLAPDAERAAWQAVELSSQRNCTLKDVKPVKQIDEW